MPATHNDADLLLRVYELRREKQLRESRDFMNQNWATDYEEHKKKYPMGSKAGQHWGRAFGYWDMVCALVDRGLIDKDLFNTCTMEHVVLFLRHRPVIEGMRREWNYPALASLERVALGHPAFADMEKWINSERAQRKPAGKASSKVKAGAKAAGGR